MADHEGPDNVGELLMDAHDRTAPRTRHHGQKFAHGTRFYDLVKDYAIKDRGVPLDAWHRVTWSQIAGLYYDVPMGSKKARDGRNSMRRYAALAIEAGLIEIRFVYYPGSNKVRCMEFKLLVPPVRSSGLHSSVG